MSIANKPKEPVTERAMILRLLVAETNRLASGESLVKSPTRAGSACLATLAGFGCDLFAGFLGNFAAALASLRGASGVTVEGALGNPFAVLFLAGPGRFNLVL